MRSEATSWEGNHFYFCTILTRERRICKGIIGSEGARVDVVEGGLEVEDVDDEVEGAAKTFIAVLGRVLKE